MITICPTVTAYDMEEYNRQIRIIAEFAERVHIDLMDGEFAPTKSPSLEQIWWPHALKADIHLMYRHPMEQLEQLVHLRPARVIIHNEATVHHMHFAAELHKEGIEVGLAILQDTPVDWIRQIMHSFDQILIFSGNLGHHGGEADLGLLEKAKQIRELDSAVDIAWDGGISDKNIANLMDGGIQTLNVGGFIQKSSEPQRAYAKLEEIINKTT